MNTPSDTTLSALPSLPPLLVKAAFSRPSGTMDFPDLTLWADTIPLNPKQINRYADVCGFNHDGNHLPPSYLHILAFRLQMQIMSRGDFPVAAMGCVHLGNRIRQRRAIHRDEELRLNCRVSHSDVTDRGVEFSFLCQAYAKSASGESVCVWEDESTYLSRSAKSPRSVKRESQADAVAFIPSQKIRVDKSTARRYARASGDYNPIHLHNLSAKMLGFRGMIVHGMWSKAHCMALLLNEQPMENLECEVAFKSPLFLPAEVELGVESDGLTRRFELRGRGGRPHLLGQLRPSTD